MTEQFLVGFVVGVLVGVLVGVMLTLVLYERAQARALTWQRTGRPEAAAHLAQPRPPGGEFAGMSEERKAQERALAHVIENGAQQIMELEPGISLEDARAKAKRAIDELGAFRSSI